MNRPISDPADLLPRDLWGRVAQHLPEASQAALATAAPFLRDTLADLPWLGMHRRRLEAAVRAAVGAAMAPRGPPTPGGEAAAKGRGAWQAALDVLAAEPCQAAYLRRLDLPSAPPAAADPAASGAAAPEVLRGLGTLCPQLADLRIGVGEAEAEAASQEAGAFGPTSALGVGLGDLRALTSLELCHRGPEALDIGSLRGLGGLRRLRLDGSGALVGDLADLGALLPRLASLSTLGCPHLRLSLPALWALEGATELALDDLPDALSHEVAGRVLPLRELRLGAIWDWSPIEDVFARLPCLEGLRVDSALGYRGRQLALSSLVALTRLEVGGLQGELFDDVCRLSRLADLRLCESPGPTALDLNLAQLPHLQRITLEGLPRLGSVFAGGRGPARVVEVRRQAVPELAALWLLPDCVLEDVAAPWPAHVRALVDEAMACPAPEDADDLEDELEALLR